jgi:ABC-type transport system involved in multi-copper enzyme maturation permease subunit
MSYFIGESRTRLWLHTPQSAFRLVSAKLLVAFVSLCVSLFVSGIFSYIACLALRGTYIAKETWNL